MTKSALILIDIQNDYFPDFPDSKMPLPGMNAAGENAAQLLSAARQNDTLIVHVQHVMASTAAPFFHPGTPGANIHTCVTPHEGEMVIPKGRPNSFFGTKLKDVLQDHNVEHLILCGAMTQMCVDATARAAVDLGFKITVAHDACAAANVAHNGVDVTANLVHASIMAPLAASYGSVLATSDCTI
ncbi:cysteine hydrolase [Octadecabacter sp. G9-8]|uniref:Cysteine hydrolase n=1 Tax=Octadecabacter dasysiphoniae TaxID=2909341 RepID=A0ABS9CTV9_9RHOB|nr:cysteine hydrolase family protein [Octadecabacter dasysiphoniae]MCF2870512.1 cysteine hydrolase [Octadecabacter dasysiphoniae]